VAGDEPVLHAPQHRLGAAAGAGGFHAAEKGRMCAPVSARLSRTALASRTAPGVSPCTQIESTLMEMVFPSIVVTLWVLDHVQHALGDRLRFGEDGPCAASWHQLAGGQVGTVGEALMATGGVGRGGFVRGAP